MYILWFLFFVFCGFFFWYLRPVVLELDFFNTVYLFFNIFIGV